MQYAEVLVDTKAARRIFHYTIPPELLPDLKRGSFVRVPFRDKEIDGVVIGIKSRRPKGVSPDKLRPLSKLISPAGAAAPALLGLAEWLSNFYLCSFADALFTILPPFPQKSNIVTESRKDPMPLKSSIYFLHGREQGRWEQYVRAITTTVAKEKRIVAIFPDHARATRFLNLLASRSALRMVFFSAKLAKAKRYGIWQRIGAGEYDVVVGTRLAVFAPVSSLGLIILDEESHPGHKNDRHPRYHAREVAWARSKLEGATLFLGSVMASLTTFSNLRQGKVKTIDIPESTAPTAIIDTRTVRSPLSPTVEDALRQSPRSIVFSTRLGAGAATRCQDCRYLFRCPNCTLPLTLHEGHTLRCHHCSHEEPLPPTCPHCHGTNLRHVGSGTERLEAYFGQRFPGHRVVRLEAAHAAVPDRWNILVGTVKILDTTLTAPLVIVAGLDTILELPDPFAIERAAQLLIQLRVRATKHFLIQTRFPDHRVFGVLEDEEGFLTDELARRTQHRYPPVVTLIRLLDRGPDQAKVQQRLLGLSRKIRTLISPKEVAVLGPGPAFYERIGELWRRHLFIKILHDSPRLREKIRRLLPSDVQIDVNPIDIL